MFHIDIPSKPPFDKGRLNTATQSFPPSHLGIEYKHSLPSVWRRLGASLRTLTRPTHQHGQKITFKAKDATLSSRGW